MSDSEVLVKVESASKKFCRSLKRSLWYGVCDVAGELIPLRKSETGGDTSDGLRPGEFWAVDDVSFELGRGECLALMGRNGAGKTTLLKMLNGLIKPDRGRITIRGRVGALIALGAGFNPVLTGRENIYVNGSVLGLRKQEIDRRFDEMVDFAEVADFIDAPVQSYSSGMQVRLGFAVATALDPDVLILDEVLAVGDAAFRAKCYNRISKLQRGAAVVFVSHSAEQVSRVCSTGLVMAAGRCLHRGDLGKTIDTYMALDASAEGSADAFLSLDEHLESGGVEVLDPSIPFGGWLTVQLRVTERQSVGPIRLRVLFYGPDGTVAAEFDSRAPIEPVERSGRALLLRTTIGPVNLLGGRYRLGVNALGVSPPASLVWSYKEYSVQVDGPATGLAACQMSSR